MNTGIINYVDGLDRSTRFILANNPSTSPETLARLANDKKWRIRRHVAENPNTPSETLERLAGDLDWFVRYTVANNPNTPQYVKEYLTAVNFWKRCYES
jgi:hypothetical protein